MPRLAIVSLMKKTAQGWLRDGALEKGAALAYYAVFSIAPLLVIITFLVGMFHTGASLQQVRTQFADFMSPEAADLIARGVVNADLAKRGGAGYTAFAVIMVIIGASAFTHELQRAVDVMWSVHHQRKRGVRAGLLRRLKTLALGVGVGVFLQISIVVNAEVSGYRRYVNAFFPGFQNMWRWVDDSVSFAVIMIIYLLSYRLFPSTKVSWRDAAFGAFVASLFFVLGRWIVALYVFQGGFSSIYGAAGSVMVLLAWLYYSSLVFLFGARFTRTRAEAREYLGGGKLFDGPDRLS